MSLKPQKAKKIIVFCSFIFYNAAHEYTNSHEFLGDLELIYSNAKKFNGADSLFAKQAVNVISSAKEFLSSYEDHLIVLERNIGKSKRGRGAYDLDEYESAMSDAEEGDVQEDGEVEMDMSTVHIHLLFLQIFVPSLNVGSKILTLSMYFLIITSMISTSTTLPKRVMTLGIDDLAYWVVLMKNPKKVCKHFWDFGLPFRIFSKNK